MAEETTQAAEFELAVRDFTALVQSLTPEQWAMRAVNAPDVGLGEDERRPVGHVAWHTAMALRRQLAFVSAVAQGHRPEDMSMEELAVHNARQAEANPDPDRDAVVQTLQEESQALAELLRQLTPKQLEGRGRTFDRDWSLRSYIKGVVIFHLRWHQSSIEATIR